MKFWQSWILGTFRSIKNRSKLNEQVKINKYLSHMHNTCQDSIGADRHYPEQGDQADFFVLCIPDILSDCPCSCIEFSLRSAVPALCPHPGASWRRPILHTLKTLCRMQLDGGELEEATHLVTSVALHRNLAGRNPAVSKMCWRLVFATGRPLDVKALSQASKILVVSEEKLSRFIYLCKFWFCFGFISDGQK